MDTCLCPTCRGPLAHRCFHCSPGRARTGVERPCDVCGSPIYVQPNQSKRGEGLYCSRTCKHRAIRGRQLKFGTTYVRRDGYRAVKTGIATYQLEHRLVVEASIGRPLRRDEEVHHINGDKLDNRLVNLEVLSPTEHQYRHIDRLRARWTRVTLTCQRCGVGYEKVASVAPTSRYCSNACRLTALHDGNRKTPV